MKLSNYIDIKRIEFVVTNACTSRCKHCSLGDISSQKKMNINKDLATALVSELSEIYEIESVMTFGGEPLLYADTTCAIHQTANEKGIPVRQVITNGYFTKDHEKISTVAKALKESGVNSLLLSIDAFHREHIPLDKVYPFAKAVVDEGISGFMLHPAWVVNREHRNKYNEETEECLSYFADLQIPVSAGNNIFPSGNAAIYLAEFYEKKVDLRMKCGEVPYTGEPDDVETLVINPNGDVVVCCFTIGNIYREHIIDIIKQYDPYANPMMRALIDGGVQKLINLAGKYGITVDTTQFYSACDVCRDIVKRLSPRIIYG